MKSSDPDTTVVVRGSPDVDYQRVINVLDALQQADITKVGLATETAQVARQSGRHHSSAAFR